MTEKQRCDATQSRTLSELFRDSQKELSLIGRVIKNSLVILILAVVSINILEQIQSYAVNVFNEKSSYALDQKSVWYWSVLQIAFLLSGAFASWVCLAKNKQQYGLVGIIACITFQSGIVVINDPTNLIAFVVLLLFISVLALVVKQYNFVYFQQQISDQLRSTFISIHSTLVGLLSVGLFPVVGYLLDKYHLFSYVSLMVLLYLCILLYLYYHFARVRAEHSIET